MDMLEFLIRVGAGAGLGALVGMEREATGKAAGLRTHALVGLGAAVFTITGIEGFGWADPSRVAAQIVSGIGFLGAGAIFRAGGLISGLTTAAGLWAAAAVGMTTGVGQVGWAVGATAIAVFILVVLRRFDVVVNRVRNDTTISATVTPAEKFLDVRDHLLSVDPHIKLREIRTRDGSARLTFGVAAANAGLIFGALSAMPEVAEVDGRE